MLKLLLLIIAFTTILITAVIFQNSAASASLGTLGSQRERTIENQPKSGVPFILHLRYVNGSIPLTGKLSYTVGFSFNEPFKISGVNKGTFDKAKVLNKTAVQFQNPSISELQNKTGLVLFSFQNGLAEKHRILTLTHNVTLSIPPSLYPQNSTASGGAGGNAIATQSGSETYPCYGTCNYYNGPSATASGGPGGIAASNRSPPLIPKAPTINQSTPIPPQSGSVTPPSATGGAATGGAGPCYGCTNNYNGGSATSGPATSGIPPRNSTAPTPLDVVTLPYGAPVSLDAISTKSIKIPNDDTSRVRLAVTNTGDAAVYDMTANVFPGLLGIVGHSTFYLGEIPANGISREFDVNVFPTHNVAGAVELPVQLTYNNAWESEFGTGTNTPYSTVSRQVTVDVIPTINQSTPIPPSGTPPLKPVKIISSPTPTRILTASLQTGPLSASIVDLAVGITDLGDKVFGLAKEAYSATTPCASISGEYVGNKTSHVGSLVQYSVEVNNCSTHAETLSISTVVPQGIKTSLETDRFDSEAQSMKKLSMFVIIPVNYLPGIYTFKIDGKVLFNFFGTFYVVSETTGNASPPFILTP